MEIPSVNQRPFLQIGWIYSLICVGWKDPQLDDPAINPVPRRTNFQLYYWVVVLITVLCWFSQSTHNPVVAIEAALLGSYTFLCNLVFWGL